jgi:hypothetical protein
LEEVVEAAAAVVDGAPASGVGGADGAWRWRPFW